LKNVKLSARLFLGFGLIIVLLVIVIVSDYFMMDAINKGEVRLLKAEAINKSTLATSRWTFDYYDIHSDESADKVKENFEITKALIDDSVDIYSDIEGENIVSEMGIDIDLYYESFIKYQNLVDLNDEYYFEMLNASNNILLQLDRLVLLQDSDVISIKSSNTTREDKINNDELTLQIADEYEEASNTNEAIIATQNAMINELRHLLIGSKSYDSEVYKHIDTVKSHCDWLYDSFDREEDKDSVEDIRNRLDIYTEKYEAYKELLDFQQAEKEKIRVLTLNITDAAEEIANSEKSKISSDRTSAIISSILLGVVSVIIGILLSIFISRGLYKNVKTNIDKLSDSAQSILSQSTKLASASHMLSESSTEQAASIEETSATMEETSSMVNQNTGNTRDANSLSVEASQVASEGVGKIQLMNISMDELKRSSTEIAKIIKVIDDIAFQTNMLALNAAVEAARAGDAGLGFAVVAEEVRNLAGKSAKAAKDTAEIIDRNIELSEQGISNSEDINASLEEIMIKTENVKKLVSDITNASEEQSKGVSQVTVAIGQMESTVQQNAELSVESAASAEQLKDESSALEEIVFELNCLVEGKKEKKCITESKNKTDDKKRKNVFNIVNRLINNKIKKNNS